MDLKIEKIDACRRKLTIEVAADRVGKEVEAAFGRLARSAKVSGFRQGKAPRKVLEMHYGGRVMEDVKEKLVEESLSEAMHDKRLDPAVMPQVEAKALPITVGAPFRYDVEIEVWPEFRLGGYTGIKAMKKKAAVEDGEVDRQLQSILEQHAEFVPVEGRPLAMGDYALLDIAVTSSGAQIEDLKSTWLEMDPKEYLPGFCEKLTGMNAGEERGFDMKLSEEAKEDLQGKDASFHVTLKEIKSKKVPALNDEFAKELGNYNNVSELRAAVKADLLNYAENREERNLLDQLNDYLLGKNDFPLPKTRVDVEVTAFARKAAERLLTQGVSKDNILEKKDEFLSASRKEVEKMLRLSRIYSAIAEREKIAVSEEELEERIRRIAERIKKDPKQLRAALEKEDKLFALREDIKREKLEAFLLKNAKIKEVRE